MKLLVRVEYTQRTIQIDVQPTDTEEGIVSKIKKQEGIPKDYMCALFHRGSQVGSHVHFCRGMYSGRFSNIKDRDIVDLKERTFQIFVQIATGDIIPLQVKSSESIEMIKNRIEDEIGVPSSSFDLCKYGLCNENITLSDSIVQQDSILYMALNLMKPDLSTRNIWNVKLMSHSGKRTVINIHRADFRDISVEHLKHIIFSLEGIPADEQRLVFAGRQMEDGRTLSDYNCENGCTIHIVLRLRGD